MARKGQQGRGGGQRGEREAGGASVREGLRTPLSSAPTLFLLMGVGV